MRFSRLMKGPTRRGVASAAAAALVAASLAACSSGTSDPTNVALRVLIFSSNEAHLALLNGIADEYRAAHPEVTSIEFQSVPSTELRTVIQTQLSAGEGPDLSWAQEHLSAEFIDNDLVIDVAPTLKADP